MEGAGSHFSLAASEIWNILGFILCQFWGACWLSFSYSRSIFPKDRFLFSPPFSETHNFLSSSAILGLSLKHGTLRWSEEGGEVQREILIYRGQLQGRVFLDDYGIWGYLVSFVLSEVQGEAE